MVGLVGADVLRDPARFGRDDSCLADRVEQRRLAVVDVTHDRDDRRTCLERLLGVFENLGLGIVVVRMLDRHLALELGGDHHHLVIGERLRRRLHRPEVHQELDDLRHRHAESLREVAQRDAGLDSRGPRRCDDLARLARAAVGRTVARPLALAGSGAPTAAVDDDATPPLGAAAARSDRSVGLAVGHLSGSSVETGESRVDADGLAEDAVERPAGGRPLEAREAPARVRAAAVACAGDERPASSWKRWSSSCVARRPQPAQVRIGLLVVDRHLDRRVSRAGAGTPPARALPNAAGVLRFTRIVGLA